MKSHLFLTLPLISCFAFVSCFPVPKEGPNKKPKEEANATLTSDDQQKIEEQREKMRLEELAKEAELKKRLQDFQGFTLDESLIQMANPGVKVLHCLPAHRGEEISETVFESQFQNIFDQTENRMHVQKALMYRLLGN